MSILHGRSLYYRALRLEKRGPGMRRASMASNEGLFDEGSGSDREEGLLVTSKPPEPVYEND